MQSLALYLSLIVAVGVLAQWVAWRFHLPGILVLLASGFALGFYKRPADFPGLNETLLFSVVSLSVAVILFEGGLTLRFREMADGGRALVRLVTVGALLTWGLSAVFAHFVLQLSWPLSNIIGSILVVTGPTVIGPLLKHVRPTGRVAAVTKWEGIVIDPIGAVLAALVLNAVFAQSVGSATWETVTGLLKTILVGLVMGCLAAQILIVFFKRYWVPDFLDNALTLALVWGSFSVSNAFQSESGLLTVTVFGILMANQQSASIRNVIEFKETLRVLLISVLFVVLASRVRWEQLKDLGWPAVGFVALLIVVVRPVSVLLSTFGSQLTFKERLFLSWMAPRGIVAAAVSSVFTLEILHMHHQGLVPDALAEEAKNLSSLVFLVIVGTVLVYGLSARWVAQKLGIGEPDPTGVLFVGADPFTIEMAKMLSSLDVPVLLVDSNYYKAADARMKGLRVSNELITREHISDHLDLRGLGHLLAMTPNDQVNALALIQLREEFDSSRQFQLAPESKASTGEHTLAGHLMGRLLFAKRATWQYLADRYEAGAKVKKTSITPDFTWEHFQKLYGESALPLFVYAPQTRRITIFEAETSSPIEPGKVLISLIDPAQNGQAE